MKRILLIISCMVIVFLNQGAAQETVKWNDKEMEELSKKFFHYSTVDGKESLVLTAQPDDKWYEKAFGDPCEDTIVKLEQPCAAVSIPDSSLILAFLQCPASRDFQYDSIVTFFDRNNLNAPMCFWRSALMRDTASYYYGSIQSLEAREVKKGEFYVVVRLSDGDGGDYWSSLAFLHINIACNVTVLSQLDANGNIEESGGTAMEYRFLDNKTVEVATTNINLVGQNVEEVSKISRKQYHLEKLYQNPKLRTFPRSSKIGAQDEDGWTPLKWAAQVGDIEAARDYLDKHVEVDAKDKYGRTPLIWATEKGHKPVVRILLSGGANVNAKDIDGWTPLMAASRDGYTEIVKLLIEKRADLNAKDNSGMTALMIASKNGHAQIVELLKAHGAK